MSLQQSKKLLVKINSLFQQFEREKHISLLERDLMLGYIRSFYESILEADLTSPASDAAQKTVIAETTTKTAEPPVSEQPKPTTESKSESKQEAKQPELPQSEPEPAVKPQQEERFAPKTVQEPPKTEQVVTPKVMGEKENDALNVDIQSILQNAPKPVAQTQKTEQRPLIKSASGRVDSNELFEEKTGRELSDKLGELPIEDLKRGMSLNERIIFLNELFDGSINEFENAIHSLNTAADFEAAKRLLVILATRFDWATKEKQAKTFIKLVKRRHS